MPAVMQLLVHSSTGRYVGDGTWTTDPREAVAWPEDYTRRVARMMNVDENELERTEGPTKENDHADQ